MVKVRFGGYHGYGIIGESTKVFYATAFGFVGRSYGI